MTAICRLRRRPVNRDAFVRWSKNVFLFVLTTMYPLPGQRRDELVAVFGQPEMEVYRAGADMRVAVDYGQSRRACLVTFQGAQASSSKNDVDKEPTYLPSKAVERLIEQLVPQAARRGKPSRSVFQSGCFAMVSEDYGMLLISRQTNECRTSGAERMLGASITWKRAECASIAEKRK
jgi:hypothetical protein